MLFTFHLNDQDKKTAPAEQTTVDAHTSPPGEESKPSFTGEPSKTSENVMVGLQNFCPG